MPDTSLTLMGLQQANQTGIANQVAPNSITPQVVAGALNNTLKFANQQDMLVLSMVQGYLSQMLGASFNTDGTLASFTALPTGTATTPATGTTTPAASQTAYPTATYATASYS